MAAMHDFVNAIHIRTNEQGDALDAVTEVLARAGYDPAAILEPGDDPPIEDPTKARVRHFLVSPPNNGWVSIFDENFVEIFDLAPRLSAEIKCPALLLWSQGNRSWGYQLADEGRTIDQYATDLNYLDGPSAGRPEVLCEYSKGTVEQFRLLFEAGKGVARGSMKIFAKLFEIENCETDYENLAAGDHAGVERFDEFVQMTFVKR
ncbi:MAG: hypothetical protein K8T20_09040 [Planctomycetes bacterium]|nr:hypothetical protein [Planctomycetota bacterium]